MQYSDIELNRTSLFTKSSSHPENPYLLLYVNMPDTGTQKEKRASGPPPKSAADETLSDVIFLE